MTNTLLTDYKLIRRNASRQIAQAFANITSAKQYGQNTNYQLHPWRNLTALQEMYQTISFNKLYQVKENQYCLVLGSAHERIYFWTNEVFVTSAEVEPEVTEQPVISVVPQEPAILTDEQLCKHWHLTIDNLFPGRIPASLFYMPTYKINNQLYVDESMIKYISEAQDKNVAVMQYETEDATLGDDRTFSIHNIIPVSIKQPEPIVEFITEPMVDYVVAVYYSYSCSNRANNKPEYFTLDKWRETVGQNDQLIAEAYGCVTSWNSTLERMTITAICCNLPKAIEQLTETALHPAEQPLQFKAFYSRKALNDYLGYSMSQYGENAVVNTANNIYESNPWHVYQTKDGKKIKYYPQSEKYLVFETDEDYHASEKASNKLLRDPETGRLFSDYNQPDRYAFASQEATAEVQSELSELQVLYAERSQTLGQYIAALREASVLKTKSELKEKEAQDFHAKMKELDEQIEAKKAKQQQQNKRLLLSEIW